MGRSDSLRNELARLQKTEADLRKGIARAESDAASARASASKKRSEALKTKSESSRRSYIRSAEAEDKKLIAAERKIGDLKTKLAANAKAQSSKTKSLGDSEKQENRTAEQEIKRQRREEIRHAEHIARVSRPTVRYVVIPEAKPEKLRVLYLTSNPEATEREVEGPDGSIIRESYWLRTEAEVRQVKAALRSSKYRDLIDLEHKPAATFQDLIDGINDFDPHIIHFSGHGGGQSLFLENGSAIEPEIVSISFALLVEALAATDTPPTMLVLNACDTLEGAEIILPAVPVVIAMADSIGDAAATIFATQFYAAIASAQSVGASLKQAKVMMKSAFLDDAKLPEYVTREGIDVDDLVLVKNVV
ncbi:CHAT domain-containing protein [Rhizobium leguminosarum bv. viciae]|uniref:CHAT domain-containing protein n=1 Tax=Rhizobium leguminosarum TaxID=384 RepID=UPI00103991A8|nr:CHAT domain-containing protein [Rhizobium leguminosarum]TBY71475.1 CHAT domain-containing protein [Rhizobium leguminosarum bv. viciae]